MIVYGMITTGILLLFVVSNHIAVNRHVKRLSNVHNIIIQEVIFELTTQNAQLTFRRWQLENSLICAYRDDHVTKRQQTEKKTLSRFTILLEDILTAVGEMFDSIGA